MQMAIITLNLEIVEFYYALRSRHVKLLKKSSDTARCRTLESEHRRRVVRSRHGASQRGLASPHVTV